ncbi:MAG: DUF4870 domain-containing protein [Coleofasciculaceae cyanobacterium]
MSDLNQGKLLSALCHGAIFLSWTLFSVGIPLVILFTTEDSVVKANAKEAINFHINAYIYTLVFVALIPLLIGFPLLIGLGIASFILPIMALVKIVDNPSQPYRYPFIFRLI